MKSSAFTPFGFGWTLVAAILFSGCFESEDVYTLNPDGSGKVEREIRFEPAEWVFFDERFRDPDRVLRNAVRDELRKARGIEVWRDVEYRWTEDERIYLRATGYFRELSEVRFHNAGIDREGLRRELTVDESGRAHLVLELQDSGEHGVLPGGDSEPATEDNVNQRIREERIDYRRSRPFLEAMFRDFRITSRFRIPGETLMVTGFDQSEDELRVTVSGGRFLESIGEIMDDTARHRELLLAGEEERERIANRMFTGKEGPFAAVYRPAAPAFDYEAGIAAAREEYAAVLEELGVAAAGGDKPGVFAEPERVVAAGVRWIPEEPGEIRGMRPFNHDPGLSLGMLAEFPEPVTSVDEVRIDTAIAADGSDLLSRERFSRTPFSHLSDDGRALSFEMRLRVPDEPTPALRRIAGEFSLVASGGVEEVDLGFGRVAIGETGSVHNAELRAADSAWSDEDQFVLALSLPVTEVEEVRVYDAEGGPFDVERRGHSSGGSWVELTLAHDAPLPEDGSLAIIRRTELREFDVPFELEDVSLVPGTR